MTHNFILKLNLEMAPRPAWAAPSRYRTIKNAAPVRAVAVTDLNSKQRDSSAEFSDWKTASKSKMKAMLSEIQEILKECKDSNWDGYEAKPISKKSCDLAIDFLSLLPNDLPSPNLVPEPTGLLGLEWESDDEEISLMISFSEESKISIGYYDNNSEEEFFGSTPYKKRVPTNLIQFLKGFM